MNLIEMLVADLEREAVPTRKALAQVPEGKDGWKPHQKSMKLGDLASLCATMPTWIAMMINQDELRISSKGGGEEFPSKKLETREHWVAALDESVATAKKALEGTTVDHLMKSWTFVLDETPVLTQPRHVAIRDSYYHAAHHRGQLTVYLRLNGEKVPSIYGPSADEGVGKP